MHTLIRYILFLQQQQPKLEFSLLLERRSLLVLQKDLYHNYLHSIAERDADSITEQNSSIKNLHMCAEKFTEEETVKRGTRLSLTIRHVPKTSKLKLKIFWYICILLKFGRYLTTINNAECRCCTMSFIIVVYSNLWRKLTLWIVAQYLYICILCVIFKAHIHHFVITFVQHSL